MLYRLRSPLHLAIVMTAIQSAFGAPAISAQAAADWRVVPDLRIGAIDRPDYTLTRIADVEVAPDGTIFVAQPTEQLIRVFDGDGQFVLTIGRQGAGPGEFRSVDSLTYTPRGLLALDRTQRRLSLLTSTGRFIASWGTPAYQYGPNMMGTPPRTRLRDGSLMVIPAYQLADGEEFRRLPLILFDSTASFRRILARLKVGDNSRRVQVDRLVSHMIQPVSSHTLWSVSPDGGGIVLVDRTFPTSSDVGVFRVVRIDLSGDTTHSRQYRVPARRIPRETIPDSIRAKVDKVAATTPFPRQQLTALYEQGWQIPEYQAPADRVIAAFDGTLWIRRGSYMEEEALWWVLDGRGEIIARVRIPTRIHVLRISRDHVWGTEKGEFDEAYVVRLRISRQ